MDFLLVVLLSGGGEFEGGAKVVSDLKVKDR